MNNKIPTRFGIAFCSLFILCQSAPAQGTAFTYQGKLSSGTNAANGSYDISFTLYTNSSGGTPAAAPVTNTAVAVSDGLFTALVNFNYSFLAGSNWLQLAVSPSGSNAFTTLTPRQQLTPAPYAVTAENVAGGGLSAGTYGNAVTLNNAANSFTGSFSGNGAGVSNVNAATLGGVSGAGFWATNGNAGANPTNGAFLGTTDNQPLEFHVNGQRAFRVEPNTNGPNVIGGNSDNAVSNGIYSAFIGGGSENSAMANYAAVVGGFANQASGAVSTAMGASTTASGQKSTAMGYNAQASGTVSTAMGHNTTASGDTSVAMGYLTTASGQFSTAMGVNTTASNYAATALGANSIAGGVISTAMGQNTVASGNASTALGYYANAAHDGTFVWADNTSTSNFSSTAVDQFLIRATGGMGINTNNPGTNALTVNGSVQITGGLTVANGTNVANVNAAQLGGLSSAGFWQTNGNIGADPANGAFLGTVDSLPLEIHVNGQRAFRVEPNATSPNIIGGYSGNMVSNGVVGAFIGGGGQLGSPQIVGGSYSSVLNGYSNVASGFASTAAGILATASGNYSTAMGEKNVASGGNAVAMGANTTASGQQSTAIGYNATANGNGATALGVGTIASGGFSTAMGYYAQAANDGTFVWADNTSITPFASTAVNQFLIRAAGGMGINTNNPGTNALLVNGSIKEVNGTISGNGGGLTNLPAANLIGTINNARVSGVAFTAGGNSFTGNQTVTNGSVGIGTVAPLAPLEIRDTSGRNLVLSGPGGAEWSFYDSAATAYSWDISGSLASFSISSSGIGYPLTILRTNGFVGIGTVTPSYNLDVTSPSGDCQIGLSSGDAGGHEWTIQSSAAGGGLLGSSFQIIDRTVGAPRILIATNGSVGIGTSSPTKGALEIDTSANGEPGYSPVGSLQTSGASTGSIGAGDPASIWAGYSVYAGRFVAFSDERIKNIIGQSDGAADLKTLLGIKITDFTYKDTIAHGNRPQKKVIAQQVERVYPQAVSKSTDEVPDIYKRATIKDGWIQLATDLKVGERVKLIGEKEKGVYPVLEVRDGTFRTDFKEAAGKVFVYGREVGDFRTVDYDAIAMLNVSATQELAKRLEEKSAKVVALERELADLKNTVRQLADTVKGAKLAAQSGTPNHPEGSNPETLTTASLEH